MSVLAAVATKLAATSAVTSDLATYRFDSVAGLTPAIFVASEIPHDAKMQDTKGIVLINAVSGSAFDVLEEPGRDVLVDVECYVASRRSLLVLDRLADNIKRTLHRADLTISGETHVMTLCDPPRSLSMVLDFPGRVVQVRVLSFE